MAKEKLLAKPRCSQCSYFKANNTNNKVGKGVCSFDGANTRGKVVCKFIIKYF